jgi:hypothetical protein
MIYAARMPNRSAKLFKLWIFQNDAITTLYGKHNPSRQIITFRYCICPTVLSSLIKQTEKEDP